MTIVRPEGWRCPSLEEFWETFVINQAKWDASFEESRLESKEWNERFEKSRLEREAKAKEWDERFEKSHREWEEMKRRIDTTNKNLGGLANSLGKLMEAMYSPKLWEDFQKLHYQFTTGSVSKKFYDGSRIIAEVDIFLENGEFVLAAEIKFKLEQDDVDEHLESLDTVREYMDKHGDRRTLLGAVGGGIVADEVRDYAMKKGLYVLVQSGNSVEIAELPKHFNVHMWTPT